MTPGHRTYSYLRAFGALFLGYHHLHLLDELQRKRKRWFSASERKNVTDRRRRALAGEGLKGPSQPSAAIQKDMAQTMSKTILVTGSSGLIGSEAVEHFD